MPTLKNTKDLKEKMKALEMKAIGEMKVEFMEICKELCPENKTQATNSDVEKAIRKVEKRNPKMPGLKSILMVWNAMHKQILIEMLTDMSIKRGASDTPQNHMLRMWGNKTKH